MNVLPFRIVAISLITLIASSAQADAPVTTLPTYEQIVLNVFSDDALQKSVYFKQFGVERDVPLPKEGEHMVVVTSDAATPNYNVEIKHVGLVYRIGVHFSVEVDIQAEVLH